MIPMRIALIAAVLVTLAVGCRSMEAAPPGQLLPEFTAALVGTSWIAEDIDGHGVMDGVQSTLTFAGPQRIAGRAGCNQFFGSVELGTGTLRLKPEGTTRMACPPAIMEQETRFLSALGTVTTFRREAGNLLLLDSGGSVRVRLVPLAPERRSSQSGMNSPSIHSEVIPLR